MWRGNAPIAGAGELVGLLRSLGKRVVFVVRTLFFVSHSMALVGADRGIALRMCG